ncbi:reverse transcriptase family protein [uncultured Thiothrix sp.]|uniref:reverse transcriptase family protein n=1 Tax=uncultured Thiothrix sp. TaxID=223185 RepID=UPI0026114550|nr:reverse transcriptase family protein [uncultured Thiothrix sp.]
MTKLTRQQIYDQIKATSKEQFILSEMQRLGYWPNDQAPSLNADLSKRKAYLHQRIRTLTQQVTDPTAALKKLHKTRMSEALAKRTETKIQREVKRYQQALAWHERQQTQLDYLGDAAGYRPDPQALPSNSQSLEHYGLPICSTGLELASLMGISLNELRFLTYSNQVSQVHHYQQFAIPKKSGGTRLISAPMPRLKRAHYWILENVLQPLALTEQAHGFITGRSIVTNAQPHLGQQIVINLDLKDFFPTITYARIKGVFAQLGYNHELATLFALLCSEPLTQTVELDGQRYYLNQNPRRLPQGAPTSPYISNLVARQLDKRLQGLATKYGFIYTRYADDLTFSTHKADAPIRGLLHWVHAIVKEEGFQVHPNKTRIMHRGRRQEVTGLTVNQALNIERHTLKQFRALLFQIQKDGYAGKTWGKNRNLLASIKSYAHYVRMINPVKGEQFLQQIALIQQTHGVPAQTLIRSTVEFRKRSAQGELPLPNMQVAQTAPKPQLSELIHYSEVLAQVEQALGLTPQTVKTDQPLPTGPAEPPKPSLANNVFSLFAGIFRGKP